MSVTGSSRMSTSWSRCIQTAAVMDDQTYSRLSHEGVQLIRGRYTWRNTIFALRDAIAQVQASGGKGLADGAPAADEDNAGAAGQVAPSAPPAEAPSVVPRSAFRGFVLRTLRRAGFLLSRTAEELEYRGGKAALALGFSMVSQYVSKRVQWLRDRLARRLRSSAGLRAQARRPNQPEPSGSPAKPRDGILFIGYVEAGLGLGETLRAMVRATETRHVPFAIYPFNIGVEQRRIGPFMPNRYETSDPYQVNVLYMAADQLPNAFANVPAELLSGSYNILRTYWELPGAPEQWKPMLEGIHELWVPNEFVQGAFETIFTGPIRIIPPCIDTEIGGTLPMRSEFGLEDGRFYYLFSFDYYSSPHRKNPLGVLAAFQEAFPDPAENVGLVIKSTGAKDHHPEIKHTLLAAAQADPRIKIIDRSLSRHEMLGLISQCDCYVSLHRSEGFGAGMVEAMLFEKAVVGTSFSGSSDFLTEEVAYPVPYTLRPVEAHEYSWHHGQQWAEPDHKWAVAILRRVYSDPAERAVKSSAAGRFARARYGKAAVGEAVEARLSGIREMLARAAGSEAP